MKAQRFIAYMPVRVKWKDFWPTLGQSKGKSSNLKDWKIPQKYLQISSAKCF